MPNIMHKVIKCPKCGRKEYYGMLYWRDGQQMCRSCIYDLWELESQWHLSLIHISEPTRPY